MRTCTVTTEHPDKQSWIRDYEIEDDSPLGQFIGRLDTENVDAIVIRLIDGTVETYDLHVS